MTKFPIATPPAADLPNYRTKRKPQRNRKVALIAANDIRAFRFATISEAVDNYLETLTGPMKRHYNPADRRKALATYIYEELKAGPKSLHVFWALGEFSNRRNRQRKDERKQELISRLRSSNFHPSR